MSVLEYCSRFALDLTCFAGPLVQDSRPAGQDYASARLARRHGPFLEVRQLIYLERVMMLKLALSDTYSSYVGEKLVPQKSGYMLASTAALRLLPGAKHQPLHRVSIQ